MSAEGKFLIFCLEMYKTAKNITGKQVMTLFNQYGITEGVKISVSMKAESF